MKYYYKNLEVKLKGTRDDQFGPTRRIAVVEDLSGVILNIPFSELSEAPRQPMKEPISMKGIDEAIAKKDSKAQLTESELTLDRLESKYRILIYFYNQLTKFLFPESDDPTGMHPDETLGYIKQEWGHYHALINKFANLQLTEKPIMNERNPECNCGCNASQVDTVKEDTSIPETPTGKRAEFLSDLQTITCAIYDLLSEKNLKYGDSALNPSKTFSKCDPIELINVRIDDKLARIKNAVGKDDEDPEWDLIGYLVLKRIAIMRMKAFNTQ